MLLKTCIIRDVETPARAHATDAGIDFKMPKIDEKFIADYLGKEANKNTRIEGTKIIVPSGENACIPAGVMVEIPFGYMGLFLNKSGFASKRDGVIGAQVIDTFYSGEVHIDIHNIGNQDLILEQGTSLAQMVMVPILSCDITECDEDALYDWMKDDKIRGASGLGSGARGK